MCGPSSATQLLNDFAQVPFPDPQVPHFKAKAASHLLLLGGCRDLLSGQPGAIQIKEDKAHRRCRQFSLMITSDHNHF